MRASRCDSFCSLAAGWRPDARKARRRSSMVKAHSPLPPTRPGSNERRRRRCQDDRAAPNSATLAILRIVCPVNSGTATASRFDGLRDGKQKISLLVGPIPRIQTGLLWSLIGIVESDW